MKGGALSVPIMGWDKNGWGMASYLNQFSNSKLGRQGKAGHAEIF